MLAAAGTGVSVPDVGDPDPGAPVGALDSGLEMRVSMPTTRLRVDEEGSVFERYSTTSSNLTVSSEGDVFNA